MNRTTLFDDTYTGPRYRYASLLRPCNLANIPDGWIVFSQRAHDKYRHGTVDYAEALAEDVRGRFDMVLVETVEGVA